MGSSTPFFAGVSGRWDHSLWHRRSLKAQALRKNHACYGVEGEERETGVCECVTAQYTKDKGNSLVQDKRQAKPQDGEGAEGAREHIPCT